VTEFRFHEYQVIPSLYGCVFTETLSRCATRNPFRGIENVTVRRLTPHADFDEMSNAVGCCLIRRDGRIARCLLGQLKRCRGP
jgi:hypothetical protein